MTALLVLLDWAAWEWALSTNHPTIGLIAGMFMAPIAVGFVWSLGRVAVALVQLGLRRATTPRERAPRTVAPAPTRAPSVPFDIEAQDERVAA